MSGIHCHMGCSVRSQSSSAVPSADSAWPSDAPPRAGVHSRICRSWLPARGHQELRRLARQQRAGEVVAQAQHLVDAAAADVGNDGF
jgi:hypothetical protein